MYCYHQCYGNNLGIVHLQHNNSSLSFMGIYLGMSCPSWQRSWWIIDHFASLRESPAGVAGASLCSWIRKIFMVSTLSTQCGLHCRAGRSLNMHLLVHILCVAMFEISSNTCPWNYTLVDKKIKLCYTVIHTARVGSAACLVYESRVQVQCASYVIKYPSHWPAHDE